MNQLFDAFVAGQTDIKYINSADCVNRYTRAAVDYVRSHSDMTFHSYELGANMLVIRFTCQPLGTEFAALFYTNIICGGELDPSFITVEFYSSFKQRLKLSGITMLRYKPRTVFSRFKWSGHLFKPVCPVTNTPYNGVKQKEI